MDSSSVQSSTVPTEEPVPADNMEEQQQQQPQQHSPPAQENDNAPSARAPSQPAAPPLPPAFIPIFLSSEMNEAAIFPPGAAVTTTTTTRTATIPAPPQRGASSLNEYSIRTTMPPPRRRNSSSNDAVRPVRSSCRSVMRCVCFPLMVLTTLVALFLFFLFIGFPFVLFLAGLLMVYYCCTTDPIPFRTLLRAMVGVEDWNGGAFDGGMMAGGEPYNVTKEDIRRGIIRRLCLGPMEWKAVLAEKTVAGGDLSQLPRDHPGRVHWRNEVSSEKILVFSAPLGSSSSVGSAEPPQVEKDETTSDAESGDITAAEMVQRELSGGTRSKIPKYLQQYGDENDDEVVEAEQDDGNESDEEQGEKDPKLLSKDASPVEPVDDTEQAPLPAAADDEETEKTPVPPDDNSSVRDRGTVCDICLLEFETGEAVAWSPNPACNHAYHEECITDWLLRKPTCPSCRHNFIILPVAGPSESDDDSSGVLDDSLDDDDDDDNNGGDDSVARQLADIDESTTADVDNWDGVQPPAAADTEGDIELGATQWTNENFDNNN